MGNVLPHPEGRSSRLLHSKRQEVRYHRFGEPLREHQPPIYFSSFPIRHFGEVTSVLRQLYREKLWHLYPSRLYRSLLAKLQVNLSVHSVSLRQSRGVPRSLMIDVDIQAGVCSPTLPAFGLWGRALFATPSVLPMGVWNRNVLQHRNS